MGKKSNMARQISMFDLWAPKPISRPVDPYGAVVKEPQEVMRRDFKSSVYAEVRLHQHTDGLWMWSITISTNEGGFGYQVGPKWGQFAESRKDALTFALDEFDTLCAQRNHGAKPRDHRDLQKIREWMASLSQGEKS